MTDSSQTKNHFECSCRGGWVVDEERNTAKRCASCWRRELLGKVPPGFAKPLDRLAPRNASQKAAIAELLADPGRGYAFMGRPGAGKTQLMYSLYLQQCAAARWPHRFAVVEMRELLGQIREMEFHPEKSRPLVVSADRIADCVAIGEPMSIYLDEFNLFGTLSDHAQAIIHELINAIWKNQQSGLFRLTLTTNLLADEFREKFGGAIYRRIEDLCRIVEFS